MPAEPASIAKPDASETLGEAAEQGNAAENDGGLNEKDPKSLKREGEKALEDVRRAEMPKSFDD